MKYIVFKIIFLLLLASTSVMAKSIKLKEYDFEAISFTGRAKLFLSSNEIETIRNGKLEYKFVLIVENVQNAKELIDSIISTNGQKISYTLPKNVEYIDITPLIQNRFKTINFEKAQITNSFNCHNLTLLVSGFHTEQTYATQTEIDFYLNNFCEEISQPEKLSISIYRHPMLSHSVTTISNDLLFEKKTNSLNQPYRLRRSNANQLTHYRCDSSKYTKIKCSELKETDTQLNKINKYYTLLSRTTKGASRIKSMFKQLIKLKKDIKQFSQLNYDCELKREAMLERINSLESLHDDLISGNLYGNGSYGGSGPKF